MKILVMDWPAIGCETVKKVFAELGNEVITFPFPHKSEQVSYGEELGHEIAVKIMETGADAVFSFNYFPVISIAAHACRCKYICWVYQCPAMMMYSMTIFFPENYIFHFDSSEVERMRNDGVPHVWYLSLAADTDYYEKLVPDEAAKKHYSADVAMIGSMYRDKYRYFQRFTGFDDYLRGYLDAAVEAQEKVYGAFFLEKILTPEIMEMVNRTVPLESEKKDGYESAEWSFAHYYLGMRVTANEREHILKALSERYDVALYTGEETPYLPKVRNMGLADYYSVAPLVMKCAKINLNTSCRSIHTGIPQRVMDIMACGGFCLSNYQADLAEEFADGEDYVCYESIDHAVELTDYYLEHEVERREIARNGCEKVRKYHDYREKCRQMLKCCENGA